MTSLALGAVGVVLGMTPIWFFLALPMGLAAVVCGSVERRRSLRRTGRPAGGVLTAGMVLGAVEDRLSRIVRELERTTGEDLSELEATAGAELDELEAAIREDLTIADQRVDEVESRLAAEQAGLPEPDRVARAQGQRGRRALTSATGGQRPRRGYGLGRDEPGAPTSRGVLRLARR